jgi:hypothetical protein
MGLLEGLPINSASKIASIRSPTSIRHPFPRTTASREFSALTSTASRTSTANKRGAAAAGRTRMRYLSRVATARPRPAQNALRLSPLASCSDTNASTAARLRRLTPLCSPLMPTLQHDFLTANKVISSDGYICLADGALRYRNSRLHERRPGLPTRLSGQGGARPAAT